MHIDELKRRYEIGRERSGDPLQIDNDKYMDVDEPYVLINHSCNPNCGFKDTVKLVALRDIKKDEEISFDYSATEWSDEQEWGDDYKYTWWTMKCKCGEKNCRGIITEFQFLPPDIQEKYFKLRILPDFIVKKFKSLLMASA